MYMFTESWLWMDDFRVLRCLWCKELLVFSHCNGHFRYIIQQSKSETSSIQGYVFSFHQTTENSRSASVDKVSASVDKDLNFLVWCLYICFLPAAANLMPGKQLKQLQGVRGCPSKKNSCRMISKQQWNIKVQGSRFGLCWKNDETCCHISIQFISIHHV